MIAIQPRLTPCHGFGQGSRVVNLWKTKMDFAPTEDQEAFRKMIRDFCKHHCSPALDREIEENERFPEELMPKLAETGIFGLCFPKEYGGFGGGAVDFAMA